MRWIVRVALTMDDVKECYFTDKDKALEYVEALNQTIEDLKTQLVDLGVEVDEVE